MRSLVNTFAVTLVVFLCFSCQKPGKEEADRKEPTAFDSLTFKLDSIHKNGQIIGFGVAMVNEKGILYANGFGYANNETKAPYTATTIQHIASVSKTLIGISLLKAQEMGKLKLDDPVNQYVGFEVVHPQFPDSIITIRHLATHTAGINDSDQYMNKAWILTPDQDLAGVRTDYPYQQLNPASNEVPMEAYLRGYLMKGGDYFSDDNFTNAAPGNRYAYSNIGATLVALVIEKATDKAFNEFTKEYILDPLQMNHSAWSLKDVDVSKHSRLYRNDYSLLPYYTAMTYPDGMLITSSEDIAKYLAELVKGFIGEGTLLSTASYEEYFKPQLTDDHFEGRKPRHPYDGDYDPALFIGHSGMGYVGHSGGDAGVGTWMYINKEDKTARFIMINTDMGNDERVKELEYYAIWDLMNEYFEPLSVAQVQ